MAFELSVDVVFGVDVVVDLDVGFKVGFDVVVCLVGVGFGCFVDVGFALRCFSPQLTLYWGGDELVWSFFVDVGLGFTVDLKVVGFGGHGFQGGYPGFLVEEGLPDEVGLLVEIETEGVGIGTAEEDVGLEMLELDQTGGNDVMDGYPGVGFGVGVGSGLGVDEAPGPSPSQLMLKVGFPILI
jgi:hypothetical protein